MSDGVRDLRDTDGSSSHTRVQRGGRLLPITLLALLGAGLAVLLTRPGAPFSAAPTTTVTEPPAASVETTIVVPPDNDPAEAPGEVEAGATGAGELSRSIGRRLAAGNAPPLTEPDAFVMGVLSSPIGAEPQLFTWSVDGSVGFNDLAPLRFWEFNADASLIAGMQRQGTTRPEVYDVFVGSPTGELVSVIEGGGATSFAWHDTEPNRLAVMFAGDGERAKVATLLVQPGAPPAFGPGAIVPDVGTLDAWGDWGFGIRHDATLFRTSVVNLQGELIAETEGLVGGPIRLPDDDVDSLLITDFEQPPTAFDPVNGTAREVPFLDAGDRVASMSRSPSDPHRIAFQLTRNGFGGLSGGRVVVVDHGERVLEVPAPAPSPLAWDASGSFLVFAMQGASVERPRLLVLEPGDRASAEAALGSAEAALGSAEAALGSVGELLTPSAFGDGQRWLAAVAVRP